MTGTLYLVATPIGNLEDMTYRAVRILSEVDEIAAEDTRNSRKLLNHFDIHTPMTSYHEFNKIEKAGCHTHRSTHVNAPIIEEFPVVMECELAEVVNTENMYAIVGRIVNVKADEEVLDEKGRVDVTKTRALIFDQFRSGYYVTGEKVGQAWNAGKDINLKK